MKPEIIQVPMRDGVTLHTELIPPKTAPAPLILIRTPYPQTLIPYASRPLQLFHDSGYAVATEACRGTGPSPGTPRFMHNEGEDGYDAIEYLAAQPWCNGQVGMYGASYLASAQWLAAKLRPPHLCAIAPQSPGAMFFYESPFLGGALLKQHLLAWPKMVDCGEAQFDEKAFQKAMNASPNSEVLAQWHGDGAMGSAFIEALDHPTLDDWWTKIMLTPETAAQIDIPIFCITGFYDGDQAGALYNWEMMERHQSSGREHRHLLIGPWRHAQMATGQAIDIGHQGFAENAHVDLPRLIRDFFDVYLKGDMRKASRLPQRCRLYLAGEESDQGQWLSSDDYAVTDSRPLYLHGGTHPHEGRLRWTAPTSSENATQFHTDWRKPIPATAIEDDPRPALEHPDARNFVSEILEQPLALLGAIQARLWMAADALDFDVVLRLIEQTADGRLINFTGELGCAAFRARYRLGFEQIVQHSGQPEQLAFHLCHSGYTLAKGSRLIVNIGGTADGLIEANHHTGEDVRSAVSRQTALQKLFHDKDHPSAIILPVLAVDQADAA